MPRLAAIALAIACLLAALLGQSAVAEDSAPSAEAPVPVEEMLEPAAELAPVEEPAATLEPAATPAPAPAALEQPADAPAEHPVPTATPAPTPEPEDHADEECTPAEQSLGERIRRAAGQFSTSTSGCDSDEETTKKQDDEPKRKKRAGKKDNKAEKKVAKVRKPAAEPKTLPLRRRDGAPIETNPTFATSTPGAAPIGVPNFFIDKFRVPPFLLSIYQAAGMEYGIRWEILAAINEIETDYGRNLNVSSAGALGWMQFMPATWKAYGVDGNRDGRKDPYNPVDAIFAAARYLRASGADQDLRKAIFAYNHADWYVDSVLMRAQVLGGLPADFVGSLTGLTQGRFPVYAKATYAGEVDTREKRVARGANAAVPVEADATRRDIRIFAREGAPAIAVNDGRIVAMGRTERLGRYVRLRDVHGNTYTYAQLGRVSKTHPVLRQRRVTRDAIARELKLPKADPKPTRAASTTTRRASRRAEASRAPSMRRRARAKVPKPVGRTKRFTAAPAWSLAGELAKQRLYAHPRRQAEPARADFEPIAGMRSFDADQYEARTLRRGSRVVAGTVLGRIGGRRGGQAPHLSFEIRPAGRGAPRIDPKPILDGWKLLETTAIYRAARRNPFFGRDARQPTVGQILLMSKDALVRRVARNRRVEIYDCGRRDILAGAIDRRVLATLEFLAASGLRPTVSSLKCGHSYYTAGGSVSHHSSGNAVDIAAINGIPVLGHQGSGSITDITVQRLLTLQGNMRPSQIITLMKYEHADNTYAMSDHHDHIHVGWRPQDGSGSRRFDAVLKPSQWLRLIDRLGEIANPRVREQPSRHAIKVVKRASQAHHGE